MNPPLVSIIVPAYNAEKYLEETIKSVLAQTHNNWEMIVIDDGSRDGTAAIVKKYTSEDKRIFYYYQENKRMASARNAGIKRARGKYVAFLDADNLFLPDKLEKQVAYLESHPDCGVCYSGIYHFYDDNPELLYGNKNEYLGPSGNIFKKVLSSNFINVLAVLVRKSVLDSYGAFPEGWYGCDEHYMWSNLSRNRVVFGFLDCRVGLLRLHSSNDSFNRHFLAKTADCSLKLLDIFKSKFSGKESKEYGEEIKRLKRRWRILKLVGIFMEHPPFSWILMPLFLWRRKKAYFFVGNKKELGI